MVARRIVLRLTAGTPFTVRTVHLGYPLAEAQPDCAGSDRAPRSEAA